MPRTFRITWLAVPHEQGVRYDADLDVPVLPEQGHVGMMPVGLEQYLTA